MRAFIQSYRKMTLVLGLLFMAGVTAFADIRIYERRGDDVVKVGSMRTDGGNAAFVCVNKECGAEPCSACHSQAPSYGQYTRQEHEVHLTRYFPRSEVRIGEGQQITFGGQKLIRERGRLVFLDAKGGKRPLPMDAQLLRNRSGEPFVIVSSDPLY